MAAAAAATATWAFMTVSTLLFYQPEKEVSVKIENQPRGAQKPFYSVHFEGFCIHHQGITGTKGSTKFPSDNFCFTFYFFLVSKHLEVWTHCLMPY